MCIMKISSAHSTKIFVKKKTVGIVAYIEMFLAPYPAIRDPSVQGPGLSNKKIEGPLLAARIGYE